MCDVPNMAVFCSESIKCFPGTTSKFIIIIIIIIIIITSTYDKNLSAFSGSLSLFAATDSLTLKIMAIFTLKLFNSLISTPFMTDGTKLTQFSQLMSFVWALNPVHLS
jgi:hypothetical protein